jgi:hypothetical protein
MSLKKLFPKPPKVPNPAVPQTPQAGAATDLTQPLNYSSLISTSAGGLKRKAPVAKRTLLGGA